MVKLSPLFVIYFSLVALDYSHAAIRYPRSLIPNLFGRDSQTTAKTILKGPTGFLSITLVGGQKNPAQNPCDPSNKPQQNSQHKPGLIDIKIPSLFSRGRSQPATPPPECPPVDITPTPDSNPVTHPSPATDVQKPVSKEPVDSTTDSAPLSTGKPVVIPQTTSSSTSPSTKATQLTTTQFLPTSSNTPEPLLSSTLYHSPAPLSSSISPSSPEPPSSSLSPNNESSTTDNVDELIDLIFNQE